MKKYYNLLANNAFISGSFFMVIGFNIANVLNLLFIIFMNQKLSPSDFGILLSLVSLITLTTSPAGAVMPTIVQFAASFYAKNELEKVKGLFLRMIRLSAGIGISILVILLFFSEQVSRFFQIENSNLLVISGFTILFGYLVIICSSFLQAKLEFKRISIINFVGTLLKLLLGITLVVLSYKVIGAVWAYFLSYFVPFFLSFFPLRTLLKKEVKTTHSQIRDLIKYGLPAAIALFGLASFITTDILLAKHFFTPENAGNYANLSLIGRMIFFLTGSLSNVMFPLIVQKHARGEDYRSTLLFSLALVIFPSVILTILYFLFPTTFILLIGRQKSYLVNAHDLGYFAIFITIYAVSNVFTNFFLAIKKTSVYIPIIFFAILQAVFIWLYHKNPMEIIVVSIVSSSLLLLTYLLYYFHATRK